MSDIDATAEKSGLPRLDDSAEITRTAIASLVAGPMPTALQIDGRPIGIEGELRGMRAQVTMSWPRGSARLRVGMVAASTERAKPEDHGHGQSLQVWSEDGGREMAWTCLEWLVRDAIREGRSNVEVTLGNAFYERGAAEEKTGIGNADLGRRARELCERSGLGSDTRVNLGTYDLEARTWKPDPTVVLGRLLTVGLIKTVLRDRERGVLIQGEAPFPIRTGGQTWTHPRPDGISAGERLTGVHLWFGPGSQQVNGVREALRFIVDETPTTADLEAWARQQGELIHKRLDIYTRPLLQLGLARRDDSTDRWSLTEAGAELLESESADVLYRAFVAHYVGFEETLAFYGRHPEGNAADLLADLNRRLGMSWAVTAQPIRRAHWLRSMGMLVGERGAWSLSAAGRHVFERLPDGFKRDLPQGDDAIEDHGNDDSVVQPARLSPDDVPLGDLQLAETLIARCCAALNAGKHLLLIGPPGTAKSAVGKALAQHAADVFGLGAPMLATASADWTAYDTIGGWTQRSDSGRLTFRPGVLTRALRDKRWLVLDELNRADIDKCLGEMFTVLAGGEAETAFTHDDDTVVRIGPDSPYDPGGWFRLIATMNVRDKTTLFRLSYALLRRFAVIEVPVPDDSTLKAIANTDAKRLGIDLHIAELAAALFVRDGGLGQIVPLGPSMLRDVLSYVKQRGPSRLAVSEGLELFVLPQLEGLEAGDAKRAHSTLASLFAGDAPALDHALRRFAAYYPHVRFGA